MPTITENTVPVWTFCPDGGCPGYETQETVGIAREIARSAFEEAGPGTVNGNSVASSFFQFLVPSGETDEYGHAVAAELECEHCGRALQVSPTPRPEYANVSNQDPMALLNRRKEAERSNERDSQVAALKAQLEAQQTQMAAFMAALAGGQQNDKPQRARKAKPEGEEPV